MEAEAKRNLKEGLFGWIEWIQNGRILRGGGFMNGLGKDMPG